MKFGSHLFPDGPVDCPEGAGGQVQERAVGVAGHLGAEVSDYSLN